MKFICIAASIHGFILTGYCVAEEEWVGAFIAATCAGLLFGAVDFIERKR